MLPDYGDINSAALVTVEEAAAALRVHEETLRRWIRAGKVPAYGFRGAVRVSVAEIKRASRFDPNERREPNQRRDVQRRAASHRSAGAKSAPPISARISDSAIPGLGEIPPAPPGSADPEPRSDAAQPDAAGE